MNFIFPGFPAVYPYQKKKRKREMTFVDEATFEIVAYYLCFPNHMHEFMTGN